MTGDQLTANRAKLGKTQEQMANLLGVSLIGYKRFETGARSIPAYIAHGATAIVYFAKHGLLEALEKLMRAKPLQRRCCIPLSLR